MNTLMGHLSRKRGFSRLGPELLVFGLGALAFLVDAYMPQDASLHDDGRFRVITVPATEALRHGPSDMPGDALGDGSEDHVQRWVRSEILYREALRLGLDESDLIVRRRLIQKMEYLLDGMAEQPDLTDSALQDYYHANSERYRRPIRYGFTHVFFSPAQGMERAAERAGTALEQLRNTGRDGAVAFGDPYPDGSRTARMSAEKIAQVFGNDFLRALGMAPAGQWAGPYRSRYGMHLVFLEPVEPEQLPPLKEIYPLLVRDYLEDSRRAQRDQQYAAMEARYVIERP